MNNAVTQAEFARLIESSRSYVTQLKRAGRLVIDDAGKVMVAESIIKIKETADPAKDETMTTAGQAGASYASSRAVKEHYQSLLSKLEFERASGILVRKEDVVSAVADVVTTFRISLENFPFRVAPEIVGKDLEQTRALLRQLIREALKGMESLFDNRLKELGDAE